jgi:hypothetical protein
MNYYLIILFSLFSLNAMDELPPEPTPQELHAQAVKASIVGMVAPFAITLPAAMVSQLVLTLPASVYCAATVAALAGSYKYYEERYPTPAYAKWKQLVQLRPQIISTILDTDRELNRKTSFSPREEDYARYGVTEYKKLIARNKSSTDGTNSLHTLLALCEPHSEHKVAASALALYLGKRKRKLESYKEAMIKLSPYNFDTTAEPLPDLYSSMPKTSWMDDFTFGDPESPKEIIVTKYTMNSCVKTIGKLENYMADLRIAMGE